MYIAVIEKRREAKRIFALQVAFAMYKFVKHNLVASYQKLSQLFGDTLDYSLEFARFLALSREIDASPFSYYSKNSPGAFIHV